MTFLADLVTVTLTSSSGVEVCITNYGARLMRIDAPDRAGCKARVLLGFDEVAAYLDEAARVAYLGATCGRVANRIAGSAFVIDDRHHALDANEGPNQLHGGPHGFDRALWDIAEVASDRVTMRHHSPDGDQGFPGALDVVATFALSPEGELAIMYEATTTRPTHVNIVSHGYFNLSGVPGTTIRDHRLKVAADGYLPIDAAQLPLDPRPAIGTAFDLTRSRVIGDALASGAEQLRLGRGYNHNLCLNGTGLREVAWLDHPGSGRTLVLSTDRPGLQLYSGSGLTSPFVPEAGLCLEAQDWPDACNRPSFPPTRLDPGQVYRSETRLRFGVQDA